MKYFIIIKIMMIKEHLWLLNWQNRYVKRFEETKYIIYDIYFEKNINILEKYNKISWHWTNLQKFYWKTKITPYKDLCKNNFHNDVLIPLKKVSYIVHTIIIMCIGASPHLYFLLNLQTIQALPPSRQFPLVYCWKQQ